MQVQIIRSPRRRKTVSASLSGNVLEVRLPEGLSPREEQDWVVQMKERLLRRVDARAQNPEADLRRRAEEINRRWFDGRLRFQIRWVSNQNFRWGSCTPATGQIRISQRLARMPGFVLDYVILHEMAHLVHPDHSAEFWALVRKNPLTERAVGFLMGWSLASNLPPAGDEDEPDLE